jgi:hypothetical protein
MNSRLLLRGVVASLMGGTVALMLAASVTAAPAIDQQQPVIDMTAGFTLAIGGFSEQKLAQVVTPGVTGILTEVRLPAACGTTLTVEVQGVTAGIPNGSHLGGQTLNFSGSFPSTFRSIIFGQPVPVTKGVPYALVLTSPDTCGIWPGPVGNPYPGGDALFDARPNPPGWLPMSYGRADLPFQTLVDAADTTPPTATCTSATNPSGQNEPNGSAGFFRLIGTDNRAVSLMVIRDSGGQFVSAPFASGDQVKVTQASGATATDQRPGPGVLVARLTLRGDAVLRVTDSSGNVTEVTCQVPPKH